MSPPASSPVTSPAGGSAGASTPATAPFDLLGDLPGGATTTVLEASAGTGKTYALAGLVTRYVAEGRARLDEMLLITFGRAASRELRARVRAQLVEAADALAVAVGAVGQPVGEPTDGALGDDDRAGAPLGPSRLLVHLCTGSPTALAERLERLRDALAGFDAATIATTHQFCQVVLRSLGVAGDSDAALRLVDNLDDLVSEVVDDLYLARFGNSVEQPALSRAEAGRLALDVVGNPRATLTPTDPAPGSVAEQRCAFAAEVLLEVERRKRRLGILGFDDLLGRLADSLLEDGAAGERMRGQWSIVLVDEFQDTDPVQWEVVERAFVGRATVVLIGDPKQAIYAFRGGDVSTYLRAVRRADARLTLDTNWRSDDVLVEALHVLMGGATLGHDEIVVREVRAAARGHRLQGAGERSAPVRLRVVGRDVFGVGARTTIKMDDLRPWIADDLATDIAALLAGEAHYAGEPLRAGDIAVIVESHRDARACRDALAAHGVPAVYTGDSDVFGSAAAADWLSLLEAFDQPHRSGLVRAAAETMFFGHTAADLAADLTAELGADGDGGAGGGGLTDQVAQTLRSWADHARERGIAAVLESALVAGLGERVLAWRGGERRMTDVEHVAQLLIETAHRERFGLPALRDWLREQTRAGGGAGERNRRLDSDAAAVQIMTVWASKGLEYPLVYLPFAFNRNIATREVVLYHDTPDSPDSPDSPAGPGAQERRCLDIGGKAQPGWKQIEERGRAEMAGDDIRLTYVALTRAKSQVVAWWAPSWDEPNGGLSRLLRGRAAGAPEVPDRVGAAKVTDLAAITGFRDWEARGALRLERAAIAAAAPAPEPGPPGPAAVRAFTRSIDPTWRRTSYSGLIRDVDPGPGTVTEPEADLEERDDETDAATAPGAGSPAPEGVAVGVAVGAAIRSPMADLPAGAGFGSLVHEVLEHADPEAPDLAAEVAARVRETLPRWPVPVGVDALVEGLLPLYDSPLGPLVPGRTLRTIGFGDRLSELDFEFPLAGGDRIGADAAPAPRLRDVGRLLAHHLSATDPLRPYAERLEQTGLGEQSLRGYLSGSIDVVLRFTEAGAEGGGEPRYVVVDYKTNRLVEAGVEATAADFTAERLTEAMLHTDYPLQALLYSVVLHRFLRWRQPGYLPERHLGGVVYLFVRGMCGAVTPIVDGQPTGVFSWQPPAELIVELSDLLAGAEVAR